VTWLSEAMLVGSVVYALWLLWRPAVRAPGDTPASARGPVGRPAVSVSDTRRARRDGRTSGPQAEPDGGAAGAAR
jgi:hypothetical protein